MRSVTGTADNVLKAGSVPKGPDESTGSPHGPPSAQHLGTLQSAQTLPTCKTNEKDIYYKNPKHETKGERKCLA